MHSEKKSFQTKKKFPTYLPYFFKLYPEPLIFLIGLIFRETHWSQTVFYVDEPFLVEQDTVISGSIAIQPNANAPR